MVRISLLAGVGGALVLEASTLFSGNAVLGSPGGWADHALVALALAVAAVAAIFSRSAALRFASLGVGWTLGWRAAALLPLGEPGGGVELLFLVGGTLGFLFIFLPFLLTTAEAPSSSGTGPGWLRALLVLVAMFPSCPGLFESRARGDWVAAHGATPLLDQPARCRVEHPVSWRTGSTKAARVRTYYPLVPEAWGGGAVPDWVDTCPAEGVVTRRVPIPADVARIRVEAARKGLTTTEAAVVYRVVPSDSRLRSVIGFVRGYYLVVVLLWLAGARWGLRAVALIESPAPNAGPIPRQSG